jgi:hypothetical protein
MRNESLCEKSIKMAANIIKILSFSVAKMTLGASGHAAAARSFEQPLLDSAMVDNKSVPSQIDGSQRSQQQPEAEEENDSTYEIIEIHEEMCVDGRASAYIKKVHEKNRNNYDASKFSSPRASLN